MQRGGGAWDDSDLAKKQLKSQDGKKITKKQWSETDKAYAAVRMTPEGKYSPIYCTGVSGQQ